MQHRGRRTRPGRRNHAVRVHAAGFRKAGEEDLASLLFDCVPPAVTRFVSLEASIIYTRWEELPFLLFDYVASSVTRFVSLEVCTIYTL